MATIPVQKEKKPRGPRKGKGNFQLEEHEVFGGRVLVFRTAQSGNVWQMRVYFRETQSNYRKSLRTEYLPEALQKAEDIYLDLRTKIQKKQPIFEKSLSELVEKYIKYRYEHDVLSKHITPERHKTIISQLKHFKYIMGENIKLSSISNDKLDNYEGLRREYRENVKQVTIANELSTIKHFYKYCFSKGYLPQECNPVFPTISKKANRNDRCSRDALTRDEYRKIYTHMRYWHTKCCGNEKDEKQFIRYFVLLLMACGARFGELRNIKWKDLEVRKDENGKDAFLRIDLQKGKTGPRIIVSNRPDLYKKLKDLSKHTDKDNFVFVSNETGEPIKKDIYYNLWHEMLEKTGLDKGEKKIVFYCLRHTYATWSLYSGVDIYELAKNMGTSIHFIETNYGHTEVEKKWKNLVAKINPKDLKTYLGK